MIGESHCQKCSVFCVVSYFEMNINISLVVLFFVVILVPAIERFI